MGDAEIKKRVRFEQAELPDDWAWHRGWRRLSRKTKHKRRDPVSLRWSTIDEAASPRA